MTSLKSQAEVFDAHYKQLLKKKVTAIVRDESLVYGLEFQDGTVAWILSDEEGNGAGFLDIQLPEGKNA